MSKQQLLKEAKMLETKLANVKKQIAKEETLRMQKLAGVITESQIINENITIPTLDEKAWKLWLQLSNDAEIEDYDLETYNHLQVNGFLKEISWVASNKDKYSNYEELSDAYNDFLDSIY
jgi:hypothetical protein